MDSLLVDRVRIVAASFMIFPDSSLKDDGGSLRRFRSRKVVRLASVAPIVRQFSKKGRHAAGTVTAPRDLRRNSAKDLLGNRFGRRYIRTHEVHSKWYNLLPDLRRQFGHIGEVVTALEVDGDAIERALIENVTAVP